MCNDTSKCTVLFKHLSFLFIIRKLNVIFQSIIKHNFECLYKLQMRKILRRIYGHKKVEGICKMRYNTEIYDLYKEVKVSVFIKLRRLQWAGHVI
jgi:hypothetical protein